MGLQWLNVKTLITVVALERVRTSLSEKLPRLEQMPPNYADHRCPNRTPYTR